MNEAMIRDKLKELLEDIKWRNILEEAIEPDFFGVEMSSIDTFEERMLMTMNTGICISFTDGSDFQLEILCRARPNNPPDDEEDE